MGGFVRVDLSHNSGFERLILDVGVPLLDRANANDAILGKHLGRLVAEAERDGETVKFHVRDDNGNRLDTACRIVPPKSLSAAHRGELTDLQERLAQVQAAPGFTSSRPLFELLSQVLERQLAGPADGDGCFFEYRDAAGPARLVWCWGFRRTDPSDATAVVCPRPKCRLLYLQPAGFKRKCPHCHPGAALASTRGPRIARIVAAAAVSLVVLLAVLYWFLRPGAIVTGVVMSSASGHPVPKAEVGIEGTDLAAPTGQDGRFQLANVRPGSRKVRVQADGFQSVTVDVRLVSGGQTPLEVRLTGVAAVSGSVIDSAEEIAVEGAEVRIPGTSLAARTQSDGSFHLAGIPAGKSELEVSADGYPATRVEQSLGPGLTPGVRLALTGTANIAGHVVNALDDQPVAGAKVRVADTQHAAETDADGRFRFERLRARTATVQVQSDGFAAQQSDVELRLDEQKTLRVLLLGDSILSGQVVKAANDEPVSGAEVRIAGTRLIARADENGRFRLPGPRSGPANIEISAKGFSTRQLREQLAAGAESSIRAAMVGDVLLAGEVIDASNNKPVPQATIRIPTLRLETRTDPTGKFRLAGVESGVRLRLEVTAAGLRAESKEQVFSPGGDNPLRIVLGGDAVLIGQVVNAADELPVSGATVRVAGTNLSGQSDAQGQFRVSGVRGGAAEVVIEASGFNPQTTKKELASGKETSLRVPLTGTGTVVGQVVNSSNNAPVPNVQITLAGSRQRATSDAEGRFRIEKARGGKATIEASAPGFRRREVPLELAENKDTSTQIALAGDAGVSGAVLNGATQKPLPGATISLAGTSLSATSNDRGEFQLEGVFAGPYKLIVTAAGYPRRQGEIQVLAGQINPVGSLKLMGAAEVSGTIVDSDKKPVAGATVRIPATDQTVVTDAAGTFQLRQLPSGPSSLEISAKGFATQRLEQALAVDQPTQLGVIRLTSNLDLQGAVINAIDGNSLPNATITLVETKSAVKADAGGYFKLTGVPARPGKLIVEAEGFFAEELAVDPTRNSQMRVVLSPKLAAGEVRIVLTWGYTPKDLDAHLYGPLPGGRQFHISHAEKQAANVRLDVDNRNGNGPETITIQRAIAGKYEFKVHVFLDAKEVAADKAKARTALGQSGADVKIYRYGAKTPEHYRIDPKAIGTVWHVASLQVSANGAVTVTPYARDQYNDSLP